MPTLVLIGIVLFVAGWAIGKWAFPPAPERISRPRYLIVNADDFGLNEEVTQGILQAWQKGVVTSTSAMINMP